jgi:NAD(P)-dependent dehydrogenase (short-subunit alcohol dehydrogenase family)
MPGKKTVIVTGAGGGIGSGLVDGFLGKGYNVVGTSLNASRSLTPTASLAVIDGDLAQPETATKVVAAAVQRFGSVDVLVNNAGIFFTKPFTEFTAEDCHQLFSINLMGFIYMTQLSVKQMLKQKSGNVVSITAALAEHPIAGVKASVPMITKGGLNAITRHLAMEYARQGLRFNAVAPGVVDTPLHKDNAKDALKALQPMGSISDVRDIVDAVLYLAEAAQVTGEILRVDGGAHAGHW